MSEEPEDPEEEILAAPELPEAPEPAGEEPGEPETPPPAEPATEPAWEQAWEKAPVPPAWLDALDDPLIVSLLEDFAGTGAVEAARSFAGDLIVEVRREAVAEVCASLKAKHGFLSLTDLCGVDHTPREPRFDLLYVLQDFETGRRVRLRVQTGEETPVPSVSQVWRGADWLEREVWDLLGVRFADHPDLTRILLAEDFEGHPLRKDFPLEGTGA
jgi:NADH-quinone oxidoreductase subunit C